LLSTVHRTHWQTTRRQVGCFSMLYWPTTECPDVLARVDNATTNPALDSRLG
jgi:hypothetical protein